MDFVLVMEDLSASGGKLYGIGEISDIALVYEATNSIAKFHA